MSKENAHNNNRETDSNVRNKEFPRMNNVIPLAKHNNSTWDSSKITLI